MLAIIAVRAVKCVCGHRNGQHERGQREGGTGKGESRELIGRKREGGHEHLRYLSQLCQFPHNAPHRSLEGRGTGERRIALH